MNRNNLFEVERQALALLLQLVESRAAAATACRDTFGSAKLEANKEVDRSRRSIAADRERDTDAISDDWEKARRSIQETFDREQAEADQLLEATTREASERARVEDEKARSLYSDAHWAAESLFDAAQNQAKEQLDAVSQIAAEGEEAIESAWGRSAPLLERNGLSRADFAHIPALNKFGEPLERMKSALLEAEEVLAGLKRAGGGIGPMLGRAKARQRIQEVGEALAAGLAAAAQARVDLLFAADRQYKHRIQEARRSRESARAKAEDKFPSWVAMIAQRCQAELAAAADKHQFDSEQLRNWRDDNLQRAEAHFSALLQQCGERYDAALAEAEAAFNQRQGTARDERDRAWNDLGRNWQEGQERLRGLIDRLKAAEAEHFLPWGSPFWQDFTASQTIPNGMRFGTLKVDMSQLPGGVPEEEDLAPSIPITMELPAFLSFPRGGSLVLKAHDRGRAAAALELQSVMLRFLTALPPGKVRFTIIDPVGLGDNFAAFMHLADYDENLISSRIWTEQGQIERRLADITAHMETVIQVYLRNQYQSIEEYNTQAGEVAEPFRVLVVANFPCNFNLDASRRLVSILQSGATCGVYTLLSIDTKQSPPQGFNPVDLESESVCLTWKNDAFQWRDPEFAKFPLSLETPPPPEEMVRLVRLIGEAGRNANRIEVPFDFVAPKPDRFWKSDSRKSISVPIGRAGATKQQMFQLGVGTAQHALVAGKTGSGKSTLMHILITNLGLHYSPEEIELYLIDFKKGVEFKAYAEGGMPHARVIAIESEREFGLSVLQRLDGILRERGDRFRDAGCNDVPGYRAFLEGLAKEANGEAGNGKTHALAASDHPKTCPQIMLVVDEFQEFFVEDDRIAQETALLLDRIVRQGRAFGMHVLLGSQTIGGAYSLARSTIDQMAVRIALQCSDADAQLILSKDNTAARLLSRPGEAVYNDANGLVEGNDLFQIVWLSESRRAEALKQIRDLAGGRGPYPPPLVFEGNVAADLAVNPLLAKLLAEPAWPAESRVATAWLGDAIAIKDPTAALFRRSSGSHLLIIGQNEESALAILSACLISLAAQHDSSAGFVLLDGTPEENPNFGALGRVASALPHNVEVAERTRLGEHLSALGALVSSRLKNETTDRSVRYLFVHGLQRCRELRKGEDDFGFGRRGGERMISPAEHFAAILKDGPVVGVHALVWCDVVTNLNRSVDRQMLREFGMRVLFQMNANDSSTLIDNPAASRLGRNRALFLTEEQAVAEKFRPYGRPSDDYLREVKARLTERLTVKTAAELEMAGS